MLAALRSQCGHMNLHVGSTTNDHSEHTLLSCSYRCVDQRVYTCIVLCDTRGGISDINVLYSTVIVVIACCVLFVYYLKLF